MPPENPRPVLARGVPDRALDVIILESLDVEADGGDGVDDFAKQHVKDGSFAGSVEA